MPVEPLLRLPPMSSQPTSLLPPSRQQQQQQAPQPQAAGLLRTRSLRRPQVGVGAGTTAASSRSTDGRGESPSRLPVKPGGGAATATATTTATGGGGGRTGRGEAGAGAGAGTAVGTVVSTATGMRSRPPSGSGTRPPRLLRRPEGDVAGARHGSGTSLSSSSATTKPPSSSRTHLLTAMKMKAMTAATGTTAKTTKTTTTKTTQTTQTMSAAPGATRRPTSSGGLPSSTSTLASGAAAASTMTHKPVLRPRPGPGSAAGPPRGHTRNKSASSITTSSTVLRPPSAQSSSAGSSSSRPNSRPPTRGAGGPGGAAGSHHRPISTTGTRTTAASASASAAPAASAAHRPAFSTLQQHYSPAKNVAPKPRMAAILAPPASPSKKPANVALSAETGRLQTTLLQLHLLHRDATAVDAAWHASARQALVEERFAAVAADHADLVRMAAARAETANAAALRQWGQAGGGGGGVGGSGRGHGRGDASLDLTLEEKIQALDAILAGVWSLAGHEPSLSLSSAATASTTSRYVHVVRRFERWAQQTASMAAARQRVDTLDELGRDDDDSDSDDDSDGGSDKEPPAAGLSAAFLSDDKAPLLDVAWHDECARLERRLQGWQQQLARISQGIQLDDVGGDSDRRYGNDDADAAATTHRREQLPSLVRILTGCHDLVDGMLEELHVMQQLERDALEQEQAWVRRMNASAGWRCGDGDGDRSGGGFQDSRPRAMEPAGAVWRLM